MFLQRGKIILTPFVTKDTCEYEDEYQTRIKERLADIIFKYSLHLI